MTSALRSSAATEQRVHEASGWRLASAKYSCRRSERNLWARSSIVIRGPRGRVAKRAPLHLDHLMHRHLHEARDFAGMVMQAHRTPAQRFPVALRCRRRLALDCISTRAFSAASFYVLNTSLIWGPGIPVALVVAWPIPTGSDRP